MTESVEQINARIDDLIAQRDQINVLLRDARSAKASLTRQNADVSTSDNKTKVKSIVEYANFRCAEASSMIRVDLEENMVRFIIDSYGDFAKFKDTYWIDYENDDTIKSMEKWLNRHLDLLDIYDTLVVDDYRVHFVNEYYEDFDTSVSNFTIVYKDKSYLDVIAKSDDDIKMTLYNDVSESCDDYNFVLDEANGVYYTVRGEDVTVSITMTEQCKLETLKFTLNEMRETLAKYSKQVKGN